MRRGGGILRTARANAVAAPFPDETFDVIYCSHVLEHVEDPLKACEELFRVSEKGMLFVPNPNTEALFQWLKPDTSKVLPVLLLPETTGAPTEVVPNCVR